MTDCLADDALDRLFREARTHSKFLDRPVPVDLLKAVYDLAKMGPTSANCLPMRIAFVISPEAKERLRPHLSAGNADKTMAAPVCAIIAHDLAFYDLLPETFPHTDARSWFVGDDAKIQETAFRNATLQGAYFILAARAMGLDAGPMSGFDNAGVDRAFFADTSIRSNFLCNLGYGNAEGVRPRGPRLAFERTCSIL